VSSVESAEPASVGPETSDMTVEMPDGRLRRAIASGIAWKLLGQGFAQVTRTVVGIILAHLLAPSDFGVAAMALVFVALTTGFTDVSLGAALVQRNLVTEEDRSTAFWTSMAVGTFVTVVGISLSPVIAHFFSQPDATKLIAAAWLSVFIGSLGRTQSALLTREMSFRSLELRTILGAAAGAAVAIPVAFAGYGPWAIIGQTLIGTTVSTALVWRVSSWRPKFLYSGKSLRTLGSFGGKTVIAQFLGNLTLYADNLLVGRFLGSTALGVYSLAYNVMFVPVARIAQPIQEVVFSGFSRLQNDPARLRNAWMRGTLLVSSLNAAAFVGMAVVAPDFVREVFGEKWEAATPVLLFLSLAGVSQTFMSLNWSTMQSIGRAGTSLRLRLFSMPTILLAFAVGLHWGVVGVAGMYALARFIVMFVSIYVTARAIEYPLTQYSREIFPVVLHCLVMVISVFLLREGLVHWGVGDGVRLLLCVVIGVVVYVGVVAWRSPELIADARRLIRPRQ
jgi:O-antigen/teichoic acid export membrane protein